MYLFNLVLSALSFGSPIELVDNNHGITAKKFQFLSLGKNSKFDINLPVQGVYVRIVYDRGAGKKYY